MKASYLVIIPIMVMVATSASAAPSTVSAAAFAGRWKIAGVAVPNTGVQALQDNDPSLMGKRLTFSPAALAWDQAAVTNDQCNAPRFTRLSAPAPRDLRAQLRKLGFPQPHGLRRPMSFGSLRPGRQPGDLPRSQRSPGAPVVR